MGRELHDRFAVAREVFAEADAVLRFALSRLCFEGPIEELTRTANTQPALLTVSCALTRVLAHEHGLRPAWVAGHSLGEFSALVAAGALGFADTLRVVRERGRAMQDAVPPGVGGMAAVLGLDVDTVRALCREVADGEVLSPANLNGGGQVVIAGHSTALRRFAERASARGAKRVIPLPVSAPFHCALMAPAAARLEEVLAPVTVGTLTCPIITNVEARASSDRARVKELLVRQVVSPVRWEESVEELARQGCAQAIEMGPGRVLSGLVKRIAPGIRCTPGEDLEAVAALRNDG
jgi:[acyl-carrier-protein] S-malonyltransferase